MSAAMQMTTPTPLSNEAPAIVLDKVNKWYGAMHVLRDVILDGRPP